MAEPAARGGGGRRTSRWAVLLVTIGLASCDGGGTSAGGDAAGEVGGDGAFAGDGVEDTDRLDVAGDGAGVDGADLVVDAAREAGGSDTVGDAAGDGGADTGGLGDASDVAIDGGDEDATSDEPDAATPWRSALYPHEWSPGWTDEAGRFLHDFSYAGYANGLRAPGAPEALPVFDVVADHGADPSGEVDATAAVQAAIDAAEAAEGGVVFFPEGLYRFEGRLTVQASGVVLRGEGPERSRLWFPTSEGMGFRSHLTIGRTPVQGELIGLAEDAATWDVEVAVADAGDLEVGDDVVVGWTITPEFVDSYGMTGTWIAFNDTWQPMAWRTVVAVDRELVPPRVQLDVPLRAPALMRDGAGLREVTGTTAECGVEGLGFNNAVAWHDAWQVSQVHALELVGVRDCWVRDVASFASPEDHAAEPVPAPHLQSGGLMVRYSKRVTVADVELGYAQNRGGGGNGYLFEVRQSSEVLFRDSIGRAGRHNFIQNWGFGATGIVWLRVRSEDGVAALSEETPRGLTGFSEFHHSLATANLIDHSFASDGWAALNRDTMSTGAGHAATESVFWNTSGDGLILSAQYGWGYVIGTSPEVLVNPLLLDVQRAGTEPEDWIEGEGVGAWLEPQSLYEDQLRRRLGE